MNLREGTRRLALLLGGAGVVAGGFFSYVELRSTLRQQADHQRFEQLTNSPAIRGVLHLAQSPDFRPDFYDRDGQVASFGLDPAASSGVRTVNYWTRSFGIQSLAMADGETLYPTSPPSASSYVLITILPVLGFFIPWGAVRAIGWVGAGFFHSTP